MTKLDLTSISSSQLEELLKEKKAEEQRLAIKRRDAYEGIRAEVVHKIMQKVMPFSEDVKSLFDFIQEETTAFYDIMNEYGRLRHDGQMNYKIKEGDFEIDVKTNKIKKFDERADIAAKRLIEFLQEWITGKERGSEDPMYQLAMTLLERNRYGDLDYKSVSKLYDLEAKFNDPEYSDIMMLFKESNVVESTATNYYFARKDKMGVWRKVELSFNRM